MKNLMTYKGFSARIEFDSRDRLFYGRLLGIEDLITFHGECVAELEDAFHEAVLDYLETCRKLGKKPQKTFSGRLMFRVPSEVHAAVSLAAKTSGKSLNQWATEVLDEAAHRI
ncbi:MAG TPA: type II toxin-antitoxin system HicB family antitoxin [Candidatus Ozemobacteraceae bacterium]|nr:type II toxin-antitoxin system HicB family antitoxin [Candidatus Ozemobacteraceae bacterium]